MKPALATICIQRPPLFKDHFFLAQTTLSLQPNILSFCCSTPFYKILVPTVDTLRYDFLVHSLILAERPVLMVGPVGTGKTSVAQGVLQRLDVSKFNILTVNLSAQVCVHACPCACACTCTCVYMLSWIHYNACYCRPHQIMSRRSLKAKWKRERKVFYTCTDHGISYVKCTCMCTFHGTPSSMYMYMYMYMPSSLAGVYVPIGSKKLLTFMDDFNMPAKDTFGSQPPLELIKQWIDYGFWYDRAKQVVKQIKVCLHRMLHEHYMSHVCHMYVTCRTCSCWRPWVHLVEEGW